MIIRRIFEKFVGFLRSPHTHDKNPFHKSGLISRMKAAQKREVDEDVKEDNSAKKHMKARLNNDAPNTLDKSNLIRHGKDRFIHPKTAEKLSVDEIRLITDVKSSCSDVDLIKAAIKLRIKHRLCARLPEDNTDSSYYIKDGLRRVYPYHYLFQASSKRRWLGRRLMEVIQKEFRDISDEALESRFKNGRIMVNAEPVHHDYVIKDNDFISNITHRHELPVLPAGIKIIFEDQDTLVINKPPSLPIHPCGRFRYNSVTNVLKLENKLEGLKVCHRIDRLVSGVVIFAKNGKRAHQMEENIKNHRVSKVYVCRVAGEFPLGPPETDGEIEVNQPIDSIPGKIGVVVAMAEGKPSVTKFKRLHYNGKSSAVICKPQSGRMHQIRVHLQYLGYPILNDSLYNSDAFGPSRGKEGKYGKSFAQLSHDLLFKHRAETWCMDGIDIQPDGYEPKLNSTIAGGDNTVPADGANMNLKIEPDIKTKRFLSEQEKEETLAALESYCSQEMVDDLKERWPYEDAKFIKDPACFDCHKEFYDPPLRNLFMYLHAISYSGPGFHYETEPPIWSLESWKY